MFKSLAKATNVRCEALYGDKSFGEEQSRLVNTETGESLVDVVITTPGRLVDHLQGTPAFTLQHLRFLVADEADRLLMQSYQDWLAKVRYVLAIARRLSLNSHTRFLLLFTSAIWALQSMTTMALLLALMWLRNAIHM